MIKFKDLKFEDLDDLAVQRLIFDTKELDSILKAHLFIERLLESMIEERLRKPDSFLKNQISFTLKVDLAHSLGIISDRILTAIKGLNSIRNKYAHKFDYHVSEEELNCLKLDWEDVQNKAYEAALKKGIEDATMLACLFLCWTLLHFRESEK